MNAVRLVSHASAIIEVAGTRILTDPWQFGTAFNDSWKLITPAAELEPLLDGVDYLWISHEHPDHFHIPTLKALPDAFKRRVMILFQQTSNCGEMVDAFNAKLGYPNVTLLPHRRWVRLNERVQVLCYQSRQVDSALAINGGGVTMLNLNDCEASEKDLKRLRRALGPVDVLLNQFSIAGFDGSPEKLPALAARILDNMVRDHRALGAATTIPFASFSYFCCPDNCMINAHANSPGAVAARFAAEGLDLTVLRPGDVFRIGEGHDSRAALAFYDDLYARRAELPLIAPPAVALDEIVTAFQRMRAKLVAIHGRAALRLLKPVVILVPDLRTTLNMSLRDGTLGKTDLAPQIEINAQPLHFMLANDFGVQTLGISGRYRLRDGLRNWVMHRALTAMLHAGIGLAPRRLLSPAQLRFFWRRRGDIFDQMRHRLGRTLD